MIIDRIENAPHYFGLGPQWKTALTAIMEYDPAKFEKGAKAELENGVRFLQFEPTTKDRSEVIFEAHRKYADIMIFAGGEEKLAWKSTPDLQNITEEYKEEGDCLLAALDDDALEVPMKPGYFIVFMPQDAHGPDIAIGAPATARRIVVKVPMTLD